jgi:hypothetical protein
MRIYIPIFAIFLIVTPAATQTQTEDVKQLSWLSGTWVGTEGRVEMEEHWTLPKGNSLLGLHRDVAGDRTVSFEFLRIEKATEGIVYIAQPQGRPPTSFRLIQSSRNRVVFENKAHDFPQRIIYWIEADTLHARVEGDQNGRLRSMEWSWKRQK